MRRQFSPRRANRGFALLALFAFLIAGVLYFVVTSLGPDFFETYRARKTEAALAEARDALVGYALQYRDKQGNGTSEVYGYLPLPDLGTSRNHNVDPNCLLDGNEIEGCRSVNFAGNIKNTTVVGRFPWRTLGTSPLRDGYGECLWLIVSGSHQSVTKADPPMNWDTLGQLDMEVANGTANLVSILVSKHDRPVAIIFSAGPALPNQDRNTSVNDDVGQCGGNYDVANYLDPKTVDALAGITNYFPGATQNASGPTLDDSGNGGADGTKALSGLGAIHKDADGKLWAHACPAGTNCTLVANDVGLALAPDALFGALRKSGNFRIDVNSMLDRMVSCLRDQIAANTFTFVPDQIQGYSSPPGKRAGRIAGDDVDHDGTPNSADGDFPASGNPLAYQCYDETQVPRGYLSHFKNLVFVAKPDAGNFTVNGINGCKGVLVFANQRGAGKSRASLDEQSTLSNYLENINLTSFTSASNTFSGPTLFDTLASGQTAEQDIVRCIPDSASLAAVNSPNLVSLGFAPLATYDPGSRTLTLGAENATTTAGAPAADLFGCAWTPETNSQGNGFRAYFTFRFNKLGTGVGNTGFAFAAIDAESNINISLPCGASGSHLGYSGNNGVTPRIASPKIGIEFDQGRNTGFSEGSGNPGRDDPCGASSCGGTAGFNSHAAIVYWGHETANATDGVTLSNDDDNVHGFPTSGSESSNLAPPPHNPSNLVATPPGIAFVDLRSKSGEGGSSYLYHVRVEVTPLTAATNLDDARAATISNVALAIPGTVLGGVTLSDGDRVLLAAQTALAENGVYAWHGPANPLTRPSDADSGGELTKAAIRVSEGISGGSTWQQTRTIGTVDVDAQSWQLYVQDVKTEVWIDHSSGTPLIIAMEDTTRPMAQLVPTASPTLRDTATIYGVVGATCGPSCPTGQTCGPGNRCFRQPMKSIRLGFTGSQWTQDQQVVINDFFASWLP